MTWILLASGAQFLNAIVAIVDKYIVSDEKAIPKPFVYAFYSLLITSGWVGVYFLSFIPGLSQLGVPSLSNVQVPTIQVVGMAFLAAYTFFIALVSLYDALKHADASDVIPVIGAVSAISSFALAYVFLDVRLTDNFIWGIVLLATGTLLVSHVQFTPSLALQTIHGGIFFGLHFIAMKALFLETSFDDGFFWSRISFVFFALSLLLVPVYLDKIKAQTKATTKKTGLIVLGTKVIAGVSSFMILKATDLGDVAVVQSLDGLKFVFIIVISVLVGRFIPETCGENNQDTTTVLRKVLYVTIITIGFVMLFT